MILILKSLLLPLLLLLTALPVHAEEKSWYEIDGIKFRFGEAQQEIVFELLDPIRTTMTEEEIITPDSELEGQNTTRSLFPVAIVFPETLMSSFSFRGVFFEYKEKTIASEIAPWTEKRATYWRQSLTGRESNQGLYF